tara:strand:+ start:326 stop:1690 length:1365 start_codon:yes stop_codon:yes gene_type:complete
MPRINIRNKKINKLTAKKYLKNDKHGKAIWLFKCDCGNNYEAAATNFKQGKLIGCGCSRGGFREGSGGANQRLDLTYKKINDLTGIKYLRSSEHGRSIWLFKCICGKNHKAEATQVARGHIKSCGCLLSRKKKEDQEKTLKEVLSFMRKNKRPPKVKELKSNNFTYSSTAAKSLGSFVKLAKKHNIKLNIVIDKRWGKAKRYDYDDTYFNKIDNYEKAYFLGLITADGNVRIPTKKTNSYTLSIGLEQTDKRILFLFKKLIKYSGPIIKTKGQKIHGKYISRPQRHIRINSKYLVNKLMSYGIVPAKSLIVKFISNKIVKDKFLPSYVRGYYDGDGTINHLNGSIKFTSGSVKILKSLEKFLNKKKILNTRIEKTKGTYGLIINSSMIYNQHKGYNQHTKNEDRELSMQNTIKFYKFMYGDRSKAYMRRKKLKIKETIKSRNKYFTNKELFTDI